MKASRKALFLDRDGTLIRHIPYLHDPDGVELLEGTRQALSRARKAGYLLFLFSNQSGIGRGMFTMREAEACNRRMIDLLELPGEVFAATCIAPEVPGDLSGYRKPNPRFILEMIESHELDPECCWMIGDSDCDMEAAVNAGIRSCRVGEDRSLDSIIDHVIAHCP